MQAIILAAGTSRRLNTITRTTPKTLINVGGKEILGRMLENLKYSGINNVTIVVGYQKDQIIHYCQSEYKDMNIRFIDNTVWYETNNAYSLKMALDKVDDDILVINGDVVCYRDLIKELVEDEHENAMAVVRKKQLNEEDMKVIVNKDDTIAEVSKEIKLEEGYGEFTGIMKLSKEYANLLKQYIKEVLPNNPNAWFEHGLNDLVSEMIVYLCDISHYPYIEIDDYDDLELANDIFPYNDPVWEQGGLHKLLEKGKRNIDDAVQLMAEFKEVCDSFGVRTWLNWGTLLGCVRDGGPFPWDTDIDICIDKKNEEILWSKIVPEMKKRRCFVPNKELHYDNDCFIIRDFERIECNTMEKAIIDGKDKYIYSSDRCKLYCPAHHIDNLEELTVMGRKFSVPSDVDKFLTGWYGKWRIPSNTKPKSF